MSLDPQSGAASLPLRCKSQISTDTTVSLPSIKIQDGSLGLAARADEKCFQPVSDAELVEQDTLRGGIGVFQRADCNVIGISLNAAQGEIHRALERAKFR